MVIFPADFCCFAVDKIKKADYNCSNCLYCLLECCNYFVRANRFVNVGVFIGYSPFETDLNDFHFIKVPRQNGD